MSTSVHSNSNINNISHDIDSILNNINSLGSILLMKVIMGADKMSQLNTSPDNTELEEVSHENYKKMYMGDFEV